MSMNLKTKIAPKTSITLSNGNVVNVSPLKIKHEKAILASGSDDPILNVKSIYGVYCDIIRDCCDINPDTLSISDYQFIVFSIRKISAGSKFTIFSDCSSCGIENKVNVDLGKLTLKSSSDFQLKISDDLIFIFSDPKMSSSILDDSNDIINSIHTVINGEETFKDGEIDRKELSEFFNNLEVEYLKQLDESGILTNKIEVNNKFTCSACKTEQDIRTQDILSFF